MNEANGQEQRAALLEVQGSQALIIHASMFMQLLAAQQAGNEKLASFYAERFPPDGLDESGTSARLRPRSHCALCHMSSWDYRLVFRAGSSSCQSRCA